MAHLLWPRQLWPQGGLIGPTFFPVYQLALTAALGITVVFSAGVAMLGPAAAGDQGFRLVETLTTIVRRSLLVFAWITLVFAVVDLSQSRLLRFTSWDPRRLPPLLKVERRISRLDSASELLLASLGLLWLLLAPPFSFLVLGGAARIMGSPRCGVGSIRRSSASPRQPSCSARSISGDHSGRQPNPLRVSGFRPERCSSWPCC